MSEKLNDDQLEAMSSTAKNTLVLAGPGTGKTTALVARLRHLIANGVSPSEILCVTFNKKAADEIADRVKRATGLRSQDLQIGTFHALANRIIRKDLKDDTPIDGGYVIWSQEWERLVKVKELIKIALKQGYYGAKIKESHIEASEVLRFIDDARETLTDPENAMIVAEESGNPFAEGHAWVYEQFESLLKTENKVDFPRMVQLAVAALETQSAAVEKFSHGFRHILIDEYQDINLSQKVMIDFLIHEGSNLWVVGDDDQAIYGWRGSDAAFLLDFEKNYSDTKRVLLSVNFRSTDIIIRSSSRLAAHLNQRFPKKFTGSRKIQGSVKFKYSEDETVENNFLLRTVLKLLKEGNKFGDIAVLARTNDLPRFLADKLVSMGIPVILKGGVTVFSNYHVRLMLSSLAISDQIKQEKPWNLKVNPDLYGFSRRIEKDGWEKKVKSIATFILNRLHKNMSDEELLLINEEVDEAKEILLKAPDGETFFKTLKDTLREPKDGNGVFLGTIHSAKGLEWKNVILMGLEEQLLPHFRSFTPKQIEEERRLTYVAITRAKDELILSAAKTRRDAPNELSRFFFELGLTQKKEVAKEKSFTKADIEKAPVRRKEWTPPLDPLEERFLGKQSFQSDQSVATGEKDSVSGWSDQVAGTGLLAVSGYTVQKEGPNEEKRRDILREVFNGEVSLPDWITENVKGQWSDPNSAYRLQKIRNTLNIALGNQKGRRNPSQQAIEKWESDIAFIDTVLLEEIIGN